MSELIAQKIKYTENMIVNCKLKEKEAKESNDKEASFYWFGCRRVYEEYAKMLEEILRNYEENVQSVEESVRFLRGL